MKVVAFVPVKGVSERVKNKNLKLLDGKELFLHTIEKLMQSDLIDQVYLDTESEEVIELASETGCNVLKRDKSLATNQTDGNKLFLNEVNNVDADIYIQVLCTSPFISLDTIHSSILKLKESSIYDSALLVRKEKIYQWSNNEPLYNIESIPNSVDLPETTIETMGLYLVKSESVKLTGRRIGNNPFLIEASPLEAIDVNWPDDFKLAELIAAGMREKDRSVLRSLKSRLTSSVLSDILDDFGYPNQVAPDLNSNISGAKIFGRAKTLKLRKLRDGESYTGIYEALKSYNQVVTDDVIVVENELKNHAYFGELNANLAIRAGASGVVIAGKTRDSEDVRLLGLPVFSSGVACQDVRKRATTESINKSITVNGVQVRPDSLIFADSEGVVIIPKNIEKRVIAEAVSRVDGEQKLLTDISLGKPTDEIVKKHGFF